MKKSMGAVAALVAMMATLLLGAATAQATVPPSQCSNTGLINITVVCDIDIDDNGVLNGNDVKILIPVTGNASNDRLTALAKALDDLNAGLKTSGEADLREIVARILADFFRGPIVMLPYA